MFKLNDTPSDCDIVMIASGTGLAPYISFLRSHIKEHSNKKMLVIHGAGYPWDLGYYSELKFIDATFDNFYYFPTLVKPDKSWNGMTGLIEDHLESDLLEREAGIEINPEKTHFFLCGNPNMIKSVSEILYRFNYEKNTVRNPGSLHIEEY